MVRYGVGLFEEEEIIIITRKRTKNPLILLTESDYLYGTIIPKNSVIPPLEASKSCMIVESTIKPNYCGLC